MKSKYSKILITGQSGIRPDSMKMEEYYSLMLPVSFSVIKLEDFIKKRFAKKIKFRVDSLWLSEFLSQAPSAIEQQWIEGIDDALDYIKKNTIKKYAVVLHSVFYNNRTLEFFSPICERYLKKLNLQIAVILIDDIYDIHTRLSSEGHIFHVSHGGARKPEAQISELINILDWRSREIMMTRHISNELQIKHYVTAVKHQKLLFENLFQKGLKTCYLSHPITAIRKYLDTGNIAHAKALIKEVYDVELRLAKICSCFFPTTIDEFRLKKDEKGEITFGLNSRWDEEKYKKPEDLLYIKPSNKSKNLFNSKINKNASYTFLLDALNKLINNQIDTRDHIMVEQCQAIFVYRPFCEGNISGGVVEELQYYSSINEKKDSLCLIYYTEKDIENLVIKYYMKELKKELELGNLIKTKRKKLDLNDAQKSELIKLWKKKNDFANFLSNYMTSKDIAFSPETRPLSGGINQAHKYRIEFVSEVVSNINKALKVYQKSSTILLTKETTLDNIIDKFKLALEEL